MKRLALVLAALLGFASDVSAQTWLTPDQPRGVACQTSPGTGDATCPPFNVPALYRGFCVYVFDNAAGASTFNLDLRFLIQDPGGNESPGLWTVAGGASKVAANEGATCWYPTTITTLPTIYTAAIADQVVTTPPTRVQIIVDKTAAVSTQFDQYVFLLK